MVRTHTRKMGEIACRVSAPGCQNVLFFVIKTTRPFGHLSCTDFDHFETTDVNRFAHAYTGEKFTNFCAWGFPGPKTAQNTVLQGGVLVIELQLKRHNCGRWGSFRGLVDIQRMCLLYVSFAGGRTVWAL